MYITVCICSQNVTVRQKVRKENVCKKCARKCTQECAKLREKYMQKTAKMCAKSREKIVCNARKKMYTKKVREKYGQENVHKNCARKMFGKIWAKNVRKNVREKYAQKMFAKKCSQKMFVKNMRKEKCS